MIAPDVPIFNEQKSSKIRCKMKSYNKICKTIDEFDHHCRSLIRTNKNEKRQSTTPMSVANEMPSIKPAAPPISDQS